MTVPDIDQKFVYVASLQAEENLGTVMIFTLVTAVQEKLNEIVDVMKNRREEEKRRKEREAEEAEKVGAERFYSLYNSFILGSSQCSSCEDLIHTVSHFPFEFKIPHSDFRCVNL